MDFTKSRGSHFLFHGIYFQSHNLHKFQPIIKSIGTWESECVVGCGCSWLVIRCSFLCYVSDLFNFGRTTRVPSLQPNWVRCGLNKSGLVCDLKMPPKLGRVYIHLFLAMALSHWRSNWTHSRSLIWRHDLQVRPCRAVFFYALFISNSKVSLCKRKMFIFLYFAELLIFGAKWTLLRPSKYSLYFN